MKKALRVIGINCLILAILLGVIELIFGSWIFKSNTLNHLNIVHNKKLTYPVNQLYSADKPIRYSRDQYGLRGLSTFGHPDKIDILTVGGSTTDQRYVDDDSTWQAIMEYSLKKAGYPLRVSNAGIDGQSTFGHIKNFSLWFPLIPELKPRFIIYYIGLNDFFRAEDKNGYDALSGDASFIEKIKDNSILFTLYRKLKGMKQVADQKIGHYHMDYTKIPFTDSGLISRDDYPAFLGKRYEQYRERIEILVKKTQAMGAVPVFATQPSRKFRLESNGRVTGVREEKVFSGFKMNGVDYYHLLNKMNEAVYEVAKKYNCPVAELTSLSIWEDADFYDSAHMTPQGTRKVGYIISETLVNYLKTTKTPE